MLNGGGVAQLKTISTWSSNDAFEGRESTARSVLDQISQLMDQLDGGKDKILTAIDRVNRLSVSLNEHTDDLDLALEELPRRSPSVDRQRDDLVKMLHALSDLSSVGHPGHRRLEGKAHPEPQLARAGPDRAR